jgi:hypothetical protein
MNAEGPLRQVCISPDKPAPTAPCGSQLAIGRITFPDLQSVETRLSDIIGQLCPFSSVLAWKLAMPIGMFFTSCDPTHPDLIPAFS